MKKTRIKSSVIGGIIGGLFYALGMAGFDFIDGENFNIYKFIFQTAFLGLFMGMLTYFNVKNKS